MRRLGRAITIAVTALLAIRFGATEEPIIIVEQCGGKCLPNYDPQCSANNQCFTSNYCESNAFGLGATILIWRIRVGSETLLSAGERLIRAVLQGDAREALPLISEEERALLGLDEAKLQEYLTVYLRPRLTGFVPDGPITVVADKALGYATVTQPLRHPDGRKNGLSFRVVVTKRGNRCDEFCRSVLMTGIRSGWKAGERWPRGAQMYQFWADQVDAALPDLERLKLRGIVRREGHAQRYVSVSWSAYRDWLRRSAAGAALHGG